MLETCKLRITQYRSAGKNDYVLTNYLRPCWRNPLQLVQALPSAGVCCLFLILLAIPLLAGINKRLVVKPDTPDGNFLDLIGLETDFDRRVTLIEQFTAMFPRSESIGWAYSQLQEANFKDGKLDKALEAGDKLLELDPEDLDAAGMNKQIATAKRDDALIKKYTALTESIARRLANAPIGMDDPDAEAARMKRIEAAGNLLAQREYALYDEAFSTSDVHKRISLLDELIKLNPRTRYLKDSLLLYYLAYRQLGETASALSAADKLLQIDGSHIDVLLFVADYHFRRKQDGRKVLEYCDRIVAVVSTKKKPGALSDAEWNYQKALYIGTAHYMAGTVYMNANQHEAADRALRLALPHVRGNPALLPAVLTSLGWSNYQLGKYAEAVGFYKQCLSFGGIYKEQAVKNLAAIKAEHDVQE
jgi:tetratricopeptide (TPR) repeat protein